MKLSNLHIINRIDPRQQDHHQRPEEDIDGLFVIT